MGEKPDVWQGTLSVMVLKTLETMGPLHRIWDCPPNRADQWRSAVGQLRNIVPVASQAGARGIHRLRVGPLRQQS